MEDEEGGERVRDGGEVVARVRQQPDEEGGRGEGGEGGEGGGGNHACPMCDRRYAHRQSLNKHLRRFHRRQPNLRLEPCPICGVRVGRGEAMRRHTRALHGDVEDGVARMRFLVQDEYVDAPPPSGDEAVDSVLERYWTSIRTNHRRRPVVDIVNIRTWEVGNGDNPRGDRVWNMLRQSWENVNVRAKVNCSVGCILRHRETGELRYFHSSENNASLFTHPRLVSTINDLRNLYDEVAQSDLDGEAQRRRPNTAWRLHTQTNLTFYVWKMNGLARVGCANLVLPQYLITANYLVAMDKRNGVPYVDNLCFFRCLALSLDCRCRPSNDCACPQNSVTSARTNQLYRVYREVVVQESHSDTPPPPECPRAFAGVGFGDLVNLERIFGLRIVVLEKIETGESHLRWNSQRTSGHRLTLNVFDNRHFSLITCTRRFTKAYICEVCERVYTRQSTLLTHHCHAAESRRRVFPGGVFAPPPTVFDRINEFPGLFIQRGYYPYRISFDMECMLVRESLPTDTNSVSYISRHEPLSLSFCSNIPGCERAVCLVRGRGEDGVKKLVDDFVAGLLECAARASQLMRARYAEQLQHMERTLERMREREEQHRSTPSDESERRRRGGREGRRLCGRLSRALDNFAAWLDIVPVVGFNSQRYDLNVLKSTLMRSLAEHGSEPQFVVKRTNNMTCVSTGELRFLDVCNFIAPGYTYASYLKAFDCAAEKGFFPYEWMDSLDKLDFDRLPDRADFYSSLKGEGISEEDYATCQKAWTEEGMQTFRDFLVWYNNLDVTPMLEALEKQSEVYRRKGIDMLKGNSISLPGLAVEWLMTETDVGERALLAQEPVDVFREVRSNLPIRLLDECDADLHDLIKTNLVGGPSIVFHRHHERGKTSLRVHEYGEEARMCDRIYGVDANSLYVYCLMQDMPTGLPRRIVRQGASNMFERAVHKGSKTAHGWLEWEARRRGVAIRHEHNGGEVRVGDRDLPVDGFQAQTSTVFQFHGCYWHGHDCLASEGDGSVGARGMSAQTLREDTVDKEMYIRSLGYRLVVKWECEWRQEVDSDPEKRTFLSTLFRSLYPRSHPSTFERCVERIRDGTFFGLVECDIAVPESLYGKFSEMAPLFKNAEVGRQQLGDEMLEYARSRNYLARSQRMLIGSLKGERVLLFSSLARWYLRHGLVISEIYQMVEYHPRALFHRFGESVSEARRQGDIDPSKKILSDTCKCVGNSVYGKTLTDKDKHRDTRYIDGHAAASALIAQANFDSLNQLTDDGFYEASLFKQQVKMDVPVHVGFVVLQYAKQRMLEFYYDFMDKYVDRRDFQCMEMDTDSLYMALSGDLRTIVRAELREEFWSEYGNWFPRPFCSQHKEAFVRCMLCQYEEEGVEWSPAACCIEARRHDTRTPGLFKVEYEGDGMVALNSKTYCCWGQESVKYSSKGVSKRTNSFGKQQFLDVLQSGVAATGINKGFVVNDNNMYTYSQVRTGLTFVYAKRRVLSDGVTTVNLDI